MMIKECTKQVMPSATALYLLTEAQPVPEHQPPTPGQLSRVLLLSVFPSSTGHPSGHLESPVLATHPPNFLCITVSCPAGQSKKMKSQLTESTAPQQPKHHCSHPESKIQHCQLPGGELTPCSQIQDILSVSFIMNTKWWRIFFFC